MTAYRPIRGRGRNGQHVSRETTRLDAADQRRKRASQGLCINGAAHGPATHGTKCERCYLVHKLGAEQVRAA